MPKTYKVSKLAASARRPNMRSGKAKHVKGRLTLLMLAVVIAVVGIYALVRYMRTDHTDGGAEIVVGSQLMAFIRAEDLEQSMSVTEALDAVAVRPTSMQTVILTGEDMELTIPASELDTLYLTAGEKEQLVLRDDDGAAIGTLERIYLPIDE